MARIILEKKVKIANNIYEVREVKYELPDHIVLNGNYLSFENYRKVYTDRYGFEISAVDYLKKVLKQAKNKTEENLDEDELKNS